MTRRSPETVRFRDFFFAFAGDLTRRVSNTFLTRDSCLKKWNQGSRALRQRTACENTLCRLMQNRPPHGAKKSDTSLIPIVSKLVSSYGADVLMGLFQQTRINKGFLRSQNSTLTQNLSKTPTKNSTVLSLKCEMRENNA